MFFIAVNIIMAVPISNVQTNREFPLLQHRALQKGQPNGRFQEIRLQKTKYIRKFGAFPGESQWIRGQNIQPWPIPIWRDRCGGVNAWLLTQVFYSLM